MHCPKSWYELNLLDNLNIYAISVLDPSIIAPHLITLRYLQSQINKNIKYANIKCNYCFDLQIQPTEGHSTVFNKIYVL
jgi:hypothetical protein